jgi:diguanylate cyclase (GGDEF)-like protein
MVTRPVHRLVEAARRMREGIYSQAIEIDSQDEFGVLAAGFNSMQEAIANREQDIVHMAHHDSLSGLPTREIVVSDLRDAIVDVDQLAVINFVLHRFDELASSLGHRTADRLIQLVAGRLRDGLEDGQLLGHLNHQEFVIVLPEADAEHAEQSVREIQSMLRSGLAVGNANISLQIRAGVSLFPDHGVNASELLRCAGIARGHASHHMRSVGFYKPGQEEKSLHLIQIVGDFPRALQNDELWVEYQPKIDCNTLELSGAEALIRWEHPKLGRLPPDTFVAAIEQAGGISQLTRWVLEEAVRTLAGWRQRGLNVSMSVNISANDLIDDYLPGYLSELASRFDIVPQSLTLEVTESAIMHDIDSSLAVVAEIRKMGFRIAIDDFGTGHSALGQLKRLPVDELKIDKSFVLNIEDQRDEAIVRTSIELAHKFGLTAVAEGVEDESSLIRLQQLGCELAQGFYFSMPLEAHEFVSWVAAWQAGEGADIVSLVTPQKPSRGTSS